MRLRKGVVDDIEHLVHRVLLFADGEATDAEPGPIVHRAYCRGGLAPELGVNSSLYDRKECLMISRVVPRELFARRILQWLCALQALHLRQAAREPADAAIAGVARRGFVRLPGNNVIELHDDVGA